MNWYYVINTQTNTQIKNDRRGHVIFYCSVFGTAAEKAIAICEQMFYDGFKTKDTEDIRMYIEKIMNLLETIEDEELLKRIYNFIYNLLCG